MLSVLAIVGTIVCYGIFGGLMVFFFSHMPTELSGAPKRACTRLPDSLTDEEAQLMRDFDLV